MDEEKAAKTSQPIEWIVVGLGNPGTKYDNTRHNAGFRALEGYCARSGQKIDRMKFKALAGEGMLGGKRVLFLKPQTFMNLSGNAVRYWMQKENIPLENVLVVVDDLALPFGTLRLKGKGSDAGHNGLKHIASTLGTQNYARLRFGIGNDFPRGGQIDYVLGHFTDEDWKTMGERLENSRRNHQKFLSGGNRYHMNQYNKK